MLVQFPVLGKGCSWLVPIDKSTKFDIQQTRSKAKRKEPDAFCPWFETTRSSMNTICHDASYISMNLEQFETQKQTSGWPKWSMPRDCICARHGKRLKTPSFGRTILVRMLLWQSTFRRHGWLVSFFVHPSQARSDEWDWAQKFERNPKSQSK